ncbi:MULTISPECIES: hypothetical protein [Enterobacteriaceae]|uniref:hypothetical protein n=1 Tax=Enterobacteriaceae TaxID=543 RepID=UPI00137556D5|nr:MULTISPECIES: hypothetical protein [Enterobacteriaceae]KAF1370019.1 hypothetical protein FHR25_001687 [Yokenella regensburgei]MBK0162455.1 hypothetical protein [Klebsiella sp. S69]
MIRSVFLFSSFFLLSGCATTDWAAINKQVSDTAANLTRTLGGSSSGESGGMQLMSPAGQQAMQSVDKTFSVPVDVDTAAARLKRHYKFISTQELETLRQSSNDGDWKAAAEDDAHPVWDAMPGSYYKMGSDWNGRDHLDIEIEKNGSGSRLYVVYRSSSSQRLAGSGVTKLMNDVRAVAAGEKR